MRICCAVPAADDLLNIKNDLSTELPAFRRTDCAGNLPAHPPSENLA
jgi:hypothetical protein